MSLKYRLSTVKPIERSLIFDFFSKYIEKDAVYKEKEAYTCREGSIIILHESGVDDSLYVEFHCNLVVDPEERSLSFHGLSWFAKFCKKHCSDIKILRNNSIIPPSGGALFSDLKWSQAFRRAIYCRDHPKDLTAKKWMQG